MGFTINIAEAILGTSYSQLSPEAIEVAKNCVLDTIGVGLAGLEEPASRIVLEHVKDLGSKTESGIIGSELKTDSADAALANGVIAHALDFDDNIWTYIGHPSAVILPATLSVGEKTNASGKDIILAYTVGLEAACRIGSLVTPALSEIGWHTTSTVGVFGAVAAAGKLMKLSHDQMVFAISLAASEAAGVKVNFGTMTKPFHAGKAAHDGVLAAELAASGFTAADSGLEHFYGFLKTFGHRPANRKIKWQWGEPFEIVGSGIVVKKFPSCTGTHPCVDACISLAERFNIEPKDIESYSCGVTPEVPREVFYEIPKNGLEGKFSMHFCSALALTYRDLKLAYFSPEYINNPTIQEVMKKCHYYVAPDLAKSKGVYSPTGKVEIHLANGKSYEQRVDLAKGNPGNPLTKKELIKKFYDCASKRLTESKANKLLDIIDHLEDLNDITKLMGMTH